MQQLETEMEQLNAEKAEIEAALNSGTLPADELIQKSNRIGELIDLLDEALLRKGRLAARYEFKDLTTDKVNQLIKEEGLDIPQQTQPMTLAEIYNYEGMDFSLGRKRVGF